MLIAVAVAPRRGAWLLALFALLAWLALQDQSRWQPWFYQYTIMLLVIAIAGREQPRSALNSGCLIVAATYIWSGLAKLNPNFTGDTFPHGCWLPLIGDSSAAATNGWHTTLGIGGADTRMLALVSGFSTRRWRQAAIYGAHRDACFHPGIRNWSAGATLQRRVWPWNLVMIAFLLILFFRRPDQYGFRWTSFGAGDSRKSLAFVLFGVMLADLQLV